MKKLEKEKLTKKLCDSLETIKTTFDELSKEHDLGLYCPICGIFSSVTPQMAGEICGECGVGVLRNEWRMKEKLGKCGL